MSAVSWLGIKGQYCHARNETEYSIVTSPSQSSSSIHQCDTYSHYNYHMSSTAMRRRSTFVHDPALDVDPRQLYLSGDRFVIENLRAAREERLTLGFNELPEEVISFRLHRYAHVHVHLHVSC